MYIHVYFTIDYIYAYYNHLILFSPIGLRVNCFETFFIVIFIHFIHYSYISLTFFLISSNLQVIDAFIKMEICRNEE